MTRRPRILILSTSYLPLIGGSELAIKHLTDRLEEYDFDLVTWRYSDSVPAYERMDRIGVYRVGRSKILLPFRMFFEALRLMRLHDYGAVHAYQASHAAVAGMMVRIVHPRMPFILTLQEGKDLARQSVMVRSLRGLVIRCSTRVTAISSYLAAFARASGAKNVDLIPNGVDISDVNDIPHNPDPTVITISRLVPKNNVAAVIRALVPVRRTVTNARLVIVGDGPLRRELAALAEREGVRQYVEFRGTVPSADVQRLLRMSDVFARPSLSEGLGSAFLEAMEARVPVVASPVGGIPDIITDGETGLLCDPTDIEAIATAIIRLFEDASLRQRIVEDAYAMVRERYTWNVVAQRMATVYRTTIA
ncbi:MAG TPA: glycosyltransferase family 4 protein [Candidatus Paceibacterota bacterium]|nr:glycosyltransferase family 4 protein [Candidatus Paceibacterota bacterium]